MDWLKDLGVRTQYYTEVCDVEFDISQDKKIATKIIARDSKTGDDKSILLTENDLLFITTGSLVEASSYGDNKTAPSLDINEDEAFRLWENIAKKSDDFGKPDVFASDVDKTNWESATITVKSNEIAEYIEKITKRNPYTGKVVTGGIVTALDFKWLMSWTINRQGQYINQPKGEIEVWVYGLFTDIEGNYVSKKNERLYWRRNRQGMVISFRSKSIWNWKTSKRNLYNSGLYAIYYSSIYAKIFWWQTICCS